MIKKYWQVFASGLQSLGICLLFTPFAFSQTPHWQNQLVNRVNTLPGHAFFIPHANESGAVSEDWFSSPFTMSLNGIWKFHYADRPADRPVNFYETGYNTADWATIPVPADWQFHGYDVPIFSNIKFPFAIKQPEPPMVPDTWNPVGSYKRTFTLPNNWQDKRVVLRLGGVSAAYYVWVNGKQVGYAEDSKMDAEFDVTSLVKAGENDISIEVYRWCDGSYLEDQDFWRLSGIERDVYLIATPKWFVQDFTNSMSYTGQYTNATVTTRVNLEQITKDNYKGQVRVKLVDAAGKTVYEQTQKASSRKGKTAPLQFVGPVPNATLWNAENPYLYTQFITLLNEKGGVEQVISQQVGIRFVELKNAQVLVNGKAVLFKGVNRHEHSAVNGHVISTEEMILDIKRMKEFNINAVRTCHYPNDARWYALCNKYGLYMVDEANIESHGMGKYTYKPYGYAMENKLAEDPSWQGAIWDRIQNMYDRDKNHPSVIFWSLGNEAGRGDNFRQAYLKLKAIDKSRPVQYEQAYLDNYTDIVAPMYHRVPKMKEFAESGDPRPMILCEYAHSMGNSTGNFKEYWDLIESYPNLQGGFIWDWMNQTFLDTLADGTKYWAYGTDLGPEIYLREKGNSDGVVFADGSPEPSMYEIKKVYQYIKFLEYKQEQQMLLIANKYDFTALSAFNFHYEVLADGEVIEKGKINADGVKTPAGDMTSVKLPLKALANNDRRECFLNVYATLKEATLLLPKGHVVATGQLLLANEKTRSVPAFTRTAIQAQVDTMEQTYLRVTTSAFTAVFELKTGYLYSYRYKENYLLKYPLVPDFWRTPVNNDLGNNMEKRCAVWKDVASQFKADKFVYRNDPGIFYLETAGKLKQTQSDVQIKYSIDLATGRIWVDMEYQATKDSLPEIPRLGMSMSLLGQYDQLSWYGRGPHENYWDRNTSAYVGLYKGSVRDQFVPYETPQENGNKTDVRWVQLTNKKGKGLRVSFVDHLLHVNAQNYQQKNMENAEHPHEVPFKDLIELHVDYKQMGVGGDNSWGLLPWDEFLLKNKKYNYSFVIDPVY